MPGQLKISRRAWPQKRRKEARNPNDLDRLWSVAVKLRIADSSVRAFFPAPYRLDWALRFEMIMQVTLTKELEQYVKTKIRTGRYADESEVLRDAWRALEERDDYESPALEAALLEGVRGPHRPYGKATLDRSRKNARAGRSG